MTSSHSEVYAVQTRLTKRKYVFFLETPLEFVYVFKVLRAFDASDATRCVGKHITQLFRCNK